MIEFLIDVFRAHADQPAIVWREREFTYQQLLDELQALESQLDDLDLQPGTVVSLEGDFSPRGVCLLLALLRRACVIVPLTESIAASRDEFLQIGEVELRLILDRDDRLASRTTSAVASHPLIQELRQRHAPGLILFSSGSTGKSKAALHDFRALLQKFQRRRHCRRAISFLLFDHIGGLNTLLYELSNGGCLVTVPSRDPDEVLAQLAKHRVELLPTSPSFLNLMLISGAWQRHDLACLKLITYGTEPMPESTLQRLHAVLPHVDLQQTYGLSELGILQAKSAASDSLWVKMGGEGFETRVVEGLLEIKARSAMLGYLNAPSPFTADGWFQTGDRVEQNGEFFRILGRASELINVGGQKVYPARVEDVVQQLEHVVEVLAYGERNPLLGQVVCVQVRLDHAEEPAAFLRRLRAHCRDRLQAFEVPMKVTFCEASLHGGRFKKLRRVDGPTAPATTVRRCTWSEIRERFSEIKRLDPGRYTSNHFRFTEPSGEIPCVFGEKTLLALTPGDGFERAYFFTVDPQELSRLLKSLNRVQPLVVSVIERAGATSVVPLLQSAGLAPLTTYRRMVRTNFANGTRGTAATAEPAFAQLTELDALFDLLQAHFDPRTDYLPDRAALRELILTDQVLVNRRDGKLCGALVFRLEGKRVNLNYLVNDSDNTLDLLRLTGTFYHLLSQRGAANGYLWINDTKPRVAQLHSLYGWTFDGLCEHFFLKAPVRQQATPSPAPDQRTAAGPATPPHHHSQERHAQDPQSTGASASGA